MKLKTLLMYVSLSLSGCQVMCQAQNVVQQQKSYMISTYKINEKQATEYTTTLSTMKLESNQLKGQRISSKQFKNEQKKIFKKYDSHVSQIFKPGQYKKWVYCLQGLERYQILSEEKLVSWDQMRSLYKVESLWIKNRDQVWNTSTEESKKLQENDDLLTDLHSKIYDVLGCEIGNWYINEKALHFNALDHMDKYGSTYNEGYKIAKIESDYSKQRGQIWEERAKNKNDKLQENEKAKLEAIKNAVPAQVANKWSSINNSSLDYTLAKRYGLKKVQISQYKDAYNEYAIEEYKISLNQNRLTVSEKVDKLHKANEVFCEKVRPLFNKETYTKWQGKRQYEFERRMKNKSYK